MGYFKDEHWIIDGEEKDLRKLRLFILSELEKEFDDEPRDFSGYLIPVITGLANGYACLFLPADGSKEGWSTSESMDEVRERILKKVYHHNAVSTRHIGIISIVDDEATGLSVERLTGEVE